MSVNVYIPTPFRHLVGNRANVKAKGANSPASVRSCSTPRASSPSTSTST